MPTAGPKERSLEEGQSSQRPELHKGRQCRPLCSGSTGRLAAKPALKLAREARVAVMRLRVT